MNGGIFIKKYDIHKELMKMDVSPAHRAFLDYVRPKCYVEASWTNQGGTVVKVIRDDRHVPVLLEVDGGRGRDYIACSDVDFFEPYDDYCGDLSEYEDFVMLTKEEIMEMDLSDEMRESYLGYYGYYGDDDEDEADDSEENDGEEVCE